jgi:hypothetical protein
VNRELEVASREYTLSKSDASWLVGAVLLPAEIRRQVLQKYVIEKGQAALVNLFAQFMGLANSVVENSKDAIEIFAICEGRIHPDGPGLNLPTIFGACNGVIVADGIAQEGLCGGCAFRIGTLANQSPVTTCDADYCGHPGEPVFYCHEHDGDAPTNACAGFARLRARRKREAA